MPGQVFKLGWLQKIWELRIPAHSVRRLIRHQQQVQAPTKSSVTCKTFVSLLVPLHPSPLGGVMQPRPSLDHDQNQCAMCGCHIQLKIAKNGVHAGQYYLHVHYVGCLPTLAARSHRHSATMTHSTRNPIGTSSQSYHPSQAARHRHPRSQVQTRVRRHP